MPSNLVGGKCLLNGTHAKPDVLDWTAPLPSVYATAHFPLTW
jgi:hypothetical protein